MGWTSSYLGSNAPVSSYLHFDNIRADLLAGKHWDAGATKYIQGYHDGTDGWLISSSGDIYLKSAGNDTFITDSTGAKYLQFNIAANKTISCEAGTIYITSFTGEVDIYKNATVGILNVHSGTSGKYLSLTHNVTGGYINCVTGDLNFTSTTCAFLFGTAGTRTVLWFYDTTLAAWKQVYVDNGLVVVA